MWVEIKQTTSQTSNPRDNSEWFKDEGVWEAVSERAPGLVGPGPQS